MTLPVTKIIQV